MTAKRDDLLEIVGPLLDALAAELAKRIAPAAHAAQDASAYYSATSNPFGSARAFRAAARRLGFRIFDVGGGGVLARRVEVDQAIERQGAEPKSKKPKKAAPPSEVDRDREELERAGVVFPLRRRAR